MLKLAATIVVTLVWSFPFAETKCNKGCDLALASYYVWEGQTLSTIATLLSSSLFNLTNQGYDYILKFNPTVPNKDTILAGSRVNVPFPCNCIDGLFLGHVFSYTVQSGDTYKQIANHTYSNLTSVSLLERYNSYDPLNLQISSIINVTVNCSCGDARVSRDYGLFVSYPLRLEDSLSSLSSQSGINSDTIQKFNPGTNFSLGTGMVFIPGKDDLGDYRPLKSGSGLGGGVIAGICIAIVIAIVIIALIIYRKCCRQKRGKAELLLPTSNDVALAVNGSGGGPSSELSSKAAIAGVTVEKSVEFSYEELASATEEFSLARKIGAGGFGSVYYAELRGERAAIKKMDMKASKEFYAELSVLTHVHHVNLVRLIGYCVEDSLFLVYEFMEKGNLSQNLRGTEPMPWETRVQIALDSARGLEYIHEHTVPVYIHRDVKSSNILLDDHMRAKVADFGLTKLTEVGNASSTRVVGTFGYMPPEYAQFGEVSTKVDVYAFGVVLYELISGKDAIVRNVESATDSKGLVALFDDALEDADSLRRLVDHKMAANYPFDSVYKMALMAKACTNENPHARPTMRSIVVGLMTLSSSTQDWDLAAFYGNHPLLNFVSSR